MTRVVTKMINRPVIVDTNWKGVSPGQTTERINPQQFQTHGQWLEKAVKLSLRTMRNIVLWSERATLLSHIRQCFERRAFFA